MFETTDFNEDIFDSDVLDNVQAEKSNKNVVKKVNANTSECPREYPFLKPVVVKKHHTKVVKRKFPGPAGLLPEMRDMNVDISKLDRRFKENNSSGENNEYFCSQNSVSNFREETWLKTLEDFKGASVNLIDTYNIAWMKDRAKTKKLINDKAPFLAASIKKIECISKTPTFILQDPTGDIEAVISEDLYDELTEFLTMNSVIVLKQFSVLAMNNSKKLYVIITLKNLIKIYSYRTKFGEHLSEMGNSEKEVEILTIQDIPNEKIINDISNIKEKYREFISSNRNKRNNKPIIKTSVSNADIQNALKGVDFFEEFLVDGNEQSSYEQIIDTNLKNQDLNLSDMNFSDNVNSIDCPANECPTSTIRIIKQNPPKEIIFQEKSKTNFFLFETSDPIPYSSLGTTELGTPPSKKVKPTTSRFRFTSKINRGNGIDGNSEENKKGCLKNYSAEAVVSENISFNKIDCSQVSILSQNKENIDEVKNVLSDLDVDMLFEDF